MPTQCALIKSQVSSIMPGDFLSRPWLSASHQIQAFYITVVRNRIRGWQLQKEQVAPRSPEYFRSTYRILSRFTRASYMTGSRRNTCLTDSSDAADHPGVHFPFFFPIVQHIMQNSPSQQEIAMGLIQRCLSGRPKISILL